MDALLSPAFACMTCDADLRTMLLGHRFPLLLLTIAPGLLAGGFLVAWATRAWARRMTADRADRPDAGALPWTATLLGMGFGGFIDGIVLHQILQVHAMISRSLPPDTLAAKGVNMFWDGVFHAATWMLALTGVVALWRLARRRDVLLSVRVFWGGLLHGWGALNVLDSVMNHYVFRYHHVVEASDAPWAWDLGFLVLGLLQILAGMLVMRSGLRVSAAG